MKVGYQAIGHFGTRLFLKDPNKHPRKQLLEAMGRKHCQKIYVDSLNGRKHIGYIIAREWFTIREIHDWQG
jgi:hypothetical protein